MGQAETHTSEPALVCAHVGTKFLEFSPAVFLLAVLVLNSTAADVRKVIDQVFNDSVTAGCHHHCRAPACPSSHRLNAPWAGCSPLQSTHTVHLYTHARGHFRTLNQTIGLWEESRASRTSTPASEHSNPADVHSAPLGTLQQPRSSAQISSEEEPDAIIKSES